MTAISMTAAVEMQQQFAALNPPRQIMRAVADITTLAAVGGAVPSDLVQYVQGWISKQQKQDRFGKAAA